MKHLNIKKSVQKGFTLIELMVVLVVIGILAAYFANTGFGAKDDANFGLAKTYLTNTMPTTIARYAMRTNGDCTAITKAILTAAPYDMDSDNVYGNAWTVAAAAPTATITFPVDSAGNAAELAAAIDAKGPISSISSAASNVSVVYRCN